ncbi:unnamed protein product [Scytosiphon promiscuus]
MAPRKASASATGGRMLNPSVEPAARRESAQERRASEGKAPRTSLRAPLEESKEVLSVRGDEHSRTGSILLAQGTDSTTGSAAMEARKQRRSIGIKRLSVNDHFKESLVHVLEDVARGVSVGIETPGIDKLQTIMTEAKEKGLGVSNLFHFFLPQSDGVKRVSTERKPSSSKEKPENTLEVGHENVEPITGGVFKETQSFKTRVEASRSSRGGKKKSAELMPSLQKGSRPSTANAKRASGSTMNTARGTIFSVSEIAGSTQGDDPAAKDGASSGSGRRKGSMSRSRSSSMEDALVRDRLITSVSFQHGLTTLGFKTSEEETAGMFDQLDTNRDGTIDLVEFTKFCLEIPSMTWKAERARRGILGNSPGLNGDRELVKAAQDMANEAMNASEYVEGGLGVVGGAKVEAAVDLGKMIYRGEKFFWRTKDLIEVIIQHNEKKGFLAIPERATAVAEILKDLKSKALAAKTDLDMGVSGGGAGDTKKQQEGTSSSSQTLPERAHAMYIADYIVHRITMPDADGNVLQPDVTRPDEEVNPGLPSSGQRDSSSKTKRGSAVARPGMMRTTFDEWDTLLVSLKLAALRFAKTKKRESYFQEFCSVTEKFEQNRVKAHRLSDEAAAFAMQVSSTLAPLAHSASAPATLPLHEASNNNTAHDEIGDNPRPGSGRIVLQDEISSRRNR